MFFVTRVTFSHITQYRMSPAVSCSVLDSLQRSYDWRDSAGDSLGDTISYFALQQLPAALQDLQQTAAGSREQREGSLRATQESERTLGQLNNNALDLLFLDVTTSFSGSSSVL